MAQEFGISERSVRTHLGELINQDYLSVIRHGLGQPNTYTILCPWEQTSDRQNMPVKAAKSAGQGGKSNRLTTRRNDKDSLTKDEQPPDGGSVSLADQIGKRYGRNARDAQALTTSLSKHPEAALQWAAEALENGLGSIQNPAAWLNAVVPRLAQELQERQREDMTRREDRLAMIRATAAFYGTVEDAAGVRARLLQDFGDAELVTEALG